MSTEEDGGVSAEGHRITGGPLEVGGTREEWRVAVGAAASRAHPSREAAEVEQAFANDIAGRIGMKTKPRLQRRTVTEWEDVE